jgi:hypothetical protein
LYIVWFIGPGAYALGSSQTLTIAQVPSDGLARALERRPDLLGIAHGFAVDAEHLANFSKSTSPR